MLGTDFSTNPIIREAVARQQAKAQRDLLFAQSSPLVQSLPNMSDLNEEELRRAIAKFGLPTLLHQGMGQQLATRRAESPQAHTALNQFVGFPSWLLPT